MKTRKQKKAGFTLVEMMVVAIIVAILAAVAIPLMAGNRERAMATEAQSGCNTVATAVKIYVVENGTGTAPTIANMSTVTAADLAGTWYSSYAVTGFVDQNTFNVVATPRDAAKTPAVTMQVAAGITTWL